MYYYTNYITQQYLLLAHNAMGCEHLADVTNHCSKGASRSTHTLVFSEQVGWGLLFLVAAVIWFLNVLSPKVSCVNKFFSLGWQHGDMVEPATHPSTGGGGEGGGRRIRNWLTALVTELVWSQLGHMSYHLSQRRTVVGLVREPQVTGFAPCGVVGPQFCFIFYFLAMRQAVWSHVMS